MEEKKIKKKIKKKYTPPRITTEELLAFGALCNGTTNGGRKSTISAPETCSSSKLKS